jgi:GntR family transcriptional regulator/MocR family aminotransferase
MRDLLFHLDPKSGESLQAQLQRHISDAILRGQLAGNEMLPSTRRLAKQMGVARNTVVLVYQLLMEQGFIESRERSGYYVAKDLSGILPPQAHPPETRPRLSSVDWSSRLARQPSNQRSITKPGNWRDYPYPFIYGQMDHNLFPLAVWRECNRQALGRLAVDEWSDDQFGADDMLLVEQIRTRVLPRRGVFVESDEILVTVGAQNALWILSGLLMSETSSIGIEDPGYADARNIFALRAGNTKPLAIDGEGLVPGPQLSELDYIYTTPSHQSPTTVTMPLHRRNELLAQATRDNFVIIEDDYEGEMNYAGETTPALKSMDKDGRVVYVGSLSKNLAPGLRIGYLVGPRQLIAEARQLRRLILRHPPANNQRCLALFLAQGHYDSLLNRLHKAYHSRWLTMRAALDKYFPASFATPTFGGSSFWVEGPKELDAQTLAIRALEHGIIIEPGDVHFFAETPPQNYFRLGFSAISEDRIEAGIQQLAKIIDTELTQGKNKENSRQTG